EEWLLLRKHRRDLALGGAVNASVGPVCLPAIEIRLGFLEALEAEPFERRPLRMADRGLDFPLAIGIAHAARKRHDVVVSEAVTVEGIQCWVVDVGAQHPFAQIIEHDDLRDRAKSAKRFLVELRPDLCAGAEDQESDGLATVAERQDEEPAAAILAGARITHHRSFAVIDLRFFARCGEDDAAGLGRLLAGEFAHIALHARVTGGETLVADQVLPDRHGVASEREAALDDLAVRLAATGARAARRLGWPRRRADVIALTARRVGGHLI